MRYDDDIQKSAEILRQVLPLMTRQDTAMHPVSYAVWYEFVAGINPGLTVELQELLSKKQKLTEAMTYGLYRKYIAEFDEATSEQISFRFQRVLSDMTDSATQAGERVSRFGDSLSYLSQSLQQSPAGKIGLDAGELQQALDNTQGLQVAVSRLKQRLEESRQETENLRQEIAKVREEAVTDSLSGLLNRKGLDKKFAEMLANEEVLARGLSILVIDIDHFKKINDNYGHLLGDKVIRGISQIIVQNIKGRDIAARFGGEEFVVLLPETGSQGAQMLAERLRAAVESMRIRRADNGEAISTVTASFGVATYRKDDSIKFLIERADKALYQAKSDGRNRVRMAADQGGEGQHAPGWV